MIYLDANLHELGEVNIDMDVEFGSSTDSSNDFEFITSPEGDTLPEAFYIPGTEIGGYIDYTKTSSSSDKITYKGFTWRGLLSKVILTPPSGSDYLIVSGEANGIIDTLVSNVLGGLFDVSSADSGLTISNYQFPLYINLLDGIEGMLEKYGYKLKIVADKSASHAPVKITLSAVEATVVEGTYNEDNGIPMSYTIDSMGINHLICAGAGELQDRMIVHLFINNNGQVSQTQYYFGLDERTAFFDYGSAQSEDDLIDYGTQRLLEQADKKVLEIMVPENQDLEIGDIVRGVFPDGTIVQSPIVQKIYKVTSGLVSTECKIKGEY